MSSWLPFSICRSIVNRFSSSLTHDRLTIGMFVLCMTTFYSAHCNLVIYCPLRIYWYSTLNSRYVSFFIHKRTSVFSQVSIPYGVAYCHPFIIAVLLALDVRVSCYRQLLSYVLAFLSLESQYLFAI